MSKARLVITAITVENRSVAEVVATYGISRSWVYELLARYRAEGEAAYEPRSRRPKTSPKALDTAVVELIVRLRKELTESGHDAGPETIAWHLSHHHRLNVSKATIARHLARHGLVTPEPKKRPKSSYIRFEAAMPNQAWQSDFTHYRLTRPDGRPGIEVEIITWLDDHSRYALHISAHRRITTSIVVATFRDTAAQHGIPTSTLTDNGMVYTVRHASLSHRGGRNGFEHQLRLWGVIQKNSRPGHPTTCGKVERFQQTLKKWLNAQPGQPATTVELQALLDRFRHEYNHRRPHRSLPHRATPAAVYDTMPKATPGPWTDTQTHERVRTDTVSKAGNVTLRIGSQMHHIGIGRTYAGTCIILLVQDLDVRVVNATTGELLRELTIDPTRDYQPTHKPPGPPPK